jgi:CBS domain-containing protein
MWERDCGAVPVVDGEGKVVAMITDRDVCMAAYTQGKPPHDIPVEGVMSKLLFTLAPSDSVATAVQLFKTRHVRRAPVVDGVGALVGILSLSDLVHASASGQIAKDIKPDALLAVVHAVSKPRHAAPPAVATRDVIVTPAPRAGAPAKTRASAGKPARKR